jgi:hypothetical protein
LAPDIRSVVYSLVPVCWLASELRYVNSLVPVCWLASELRCYLSCASLLVRL